MKFSAFGKATMDVDPSLRSDLAASPRPELDAVSQTQLGDAVSRHSSSLSPRTLGLLVDALCCTFGFYRGACRLQQTKDIVFNFGHLRQRL